MIIQLNTDHNTDGDEEFGQKLITLIKDRLWWYSNHITRVEAHMTEKNVDIQGKYDVECLLDVRVEAMLPFAVNHTANTYNKALDGAIHKLKSALETKLSRIRDRDVSNTLDPVYD